MTEPDWNWKLKDARCHVCRVMDRGPVCGRPKVQAGSLMLCPEHDAAVLAQMRKQGGKE